jgi:hypothetical protein
VASSALCPGAYCDSWSRPDRYDHGQGKHNLSLQRLATTRGGRQIGPQARRSNPSTRLIRSIGFTMGRSRPVSGLSEPRRKPTLAPPHPGRSRPCGRTPCTGSAASASSLGGSRSKLAKAGWPTHGHPVTAQIVVRDDARVWSMRQDRIWSRLARISVS